MASIADIVQGHLNKLTGENKELAEHRINICATSGPEGKPCWFFAVEELKCLRCGCPMKAKGTLQKEKCPIGKW